ncbi:MAG TPA: ATP-binding cassette domain-containing protein [Candidatus Nanoarchaeia archaeon]|nr:ATP-binding cassette domain-containing protein [Candidatus Nanoarchaeia archaeon]
MSQNAIIVKDLKKSFKKLKVLKGINFSVKKGNILAILGPNGAGKTTTVRILSTLIKPDSGLALVNNHDIVKEPNLVRASIGLTGQYAAVDEYLNGEENLEMMGRLYHLPKKDAKHRARELLKQFDLVDASKRAVKTYSGGMRRRLDLAMSLIASPPVVFLDEPTTGLDPPSRLMMWTTIKKLAAKGTTILLTTQYMEEADNLANKIIVIDEGKVIAEGTSDELKKKIGSERLEITVTGDLQRAAKVIGGRVDEQRQTIIIAQGGVEKLKEALAKLETANVKVESISLHKPTLDDVFLTLTGHTATQDAEREARRKK